MEDEARRIDEIRGLFDQRGYDLWLHKIQGGPWRSPYMPKDQRFGAGAFGTGRTEVEAAEDALRQFEAGLESGVAALTIPFESVQGINKSLGAVIQKSGTVTSQASVSGEAQVISGVGGIASEEQVGMPTVGQLEAATSEKLAGYGWKLWFEDEPDGSVTALLMDFDNGEVLKTATGNDHVDAYLALGIDTLPPSQELRKQQQRSS